MDHSARKWWRLITALATFIGPMAFFFIKSRADRAELPVQFVVMMVAMLGFGLFTAVKQSHLIEGFGRKKIRGKTTTEFHSTGRSMATEIINDDPHS